MGERPNIRGQVGRMRINKNLLLGIKFSGHKPRSEIARSCGYIFNSFSYILVIFSVLLRNIQNNFTMAILINTQRMPYPSKEMLHSMFNAALFTVGKNWGHLNCPLTE